MDKKNTRPQINQKVPHPKVTPPKKDPPKDSHEIIPQGLARYIQFEIGRQLRGRK